MARTLSFLVLVVFGSCLVGNPLPPTPSKGEASAQNAPTRAFPERTVLLGCGLSEREVLSITASLAAGGQSVEFLLDSANAAPQLGTFLGRYRPQQVIPVGRLRDGKKDLD